MKNLFILGMVLLNVNAFAGNEKGNGGFLYSRTSKKLLDVAQASVNEELVTLIKNGHTTYHSSTCNLDVNLGKLNSLVRDLKYNYTGSTVGTNPDGYEENRYFELSNDDKVTATEVYFSSFVDSFFRYQEETDVKKKEDIIAPIRKGIIHEALHLFGYNEQGSDLCSSEIIQQLEKSNEVKVERLANEIRKQNENVVVQYTCNEFKILDLESISLTDSVNFRDLQRDQIAHSIYTNAVAWDKKGITWESEKRPLYEVVSAISSRLKEGKNNCVEVAHYLDSILKFSFEKTIPTVQK